jgi:hypothetical protein
VRLSYYHVFDLFRGIIVYETHVLMLCRIACYYLLLGVEQFQERKLEESVEQLTVAYIVNQRLLEDPPIMANPKLKVNLFHISDVLVTLDQFTELGSFTIKSAVLIFQPLEIV